MHQLKHTGAPFVYGQGLHHKAFTRLRADDWVAAGNRRLGERLRDKTVAIIEGHQPEPVPDSVAEEIAYIMEEISAA
jgi:hypothetical protein